MGVKTYRELIVWQKGTELAKVVYLLTRNFPRHELYGLAGQLRRAAVSVPSNIAEGQARRNINLFKVHLSYALGSLAEVDTQLYLAREFLYVTDADIAPAQRLIAQLQRMIHSLMGKLPSHRLVN
jgi:four helix bundle protein